MNTTVSSSKTIGMVLPMLPASAGALASRVLVCSCIILFLKFPLMGGARKNRQWCNLPVYQDKPEFLVPGNQETTSPPRIFESARKSPRNYLNSAENFAFLRLRCSGEPQENKKITIFVLSDFFSGNLRKNLVFDLLT